MEQFPLQEIIPLMIDDFKPSIWPISNTNLTNNEQILDSLSTILYSKGASLLRLLEYIVGNETFQTAVRNTLLINDQSNVLNTFYSNFDTILNTTITVEEFLRSWIEERNYPIVTIDFIPGDDITNKNTTILFRQTRYLGSFELNDSLLDPNYLWKIYIECDLGGFNDGTDLNLTANYAPSKIKFLFQSSTHVELLDEEYLWIKCNKNFYSYQLTEYILDGDSYGLWRSFEFLFNEVC
jgi:aminopeptidase N